MKKYDWLKLIGVRPLTPGEKGPELPVDPPAKMPFLDEWARDRETEKLVGKLLKGGKSDLVAQAHDWMKREGIEHVCDDPTCIRKKGDAIREFSKTAREFLLQDPEGVTDEGLRALLITTGEGEDRESTILDEARRNNHYASELLDMAGEPSDISLSPAELELLKSIVGRELRLACLERMAIIQHKHHLREIKGLGSDEAKNRLEFYDKLVADLRHLMSRLH